MVWQTAKSALERYGYRVLTAGGGREALALFAHTPARIDLVVLDMTMPDMPGDEVMRRMHEIRPELPVIASSGFSEQDARARFGNRAAGLLPKPYTSAQLAACVKKTLPSTKPS